MPQLYDYEQFYTPMKATAKVKLDLSGIPLKTLASVEDEEGEITLNERVTNNVMEYVQSVVVAGVRTLVMGSSSNEVVHVHFGETDIYVAPGYLADALVASGVVKPNLTQYRRKPDTLVNGQTIKTSDDETYTVSITFEIYSKESPIPTTVPVSSVTINYIPRYLLMVHPETLQQSQDFGWMGNVQVYRSSLGVLGFDRVREHGRKWFTKTAPKDRRAVCSYDGLQKTLKYMSEFYNESGMGLEVAYYDDKFKQPVETDPPTRDEWKRDRKAARRKLKQYMREVAVKDLGYTVTDMRSKTKFSELSGKFDAWEPNVNKIYAEVADADVIAQGGTADYSKRLVSSLAGTEETGGTGTALIPNVCDAFKSFYYSTDELVSSFNDAMTEVIDEMKNRKGDDKNHYSVVTGFIKQMQQTSYKESDCYKYAIDFGELRRSMYTISRSGVDYTALGYNPRELTLRLRALSIRGANEYFTDYTNIKDDGGIRNRLVIAGPGCVFNQSGTAGLPGATTADIERYHANLLYAGISDPNEYILEKVTTTYNADQVKSYLISVYQEWLVNQSKQWNYGSSDGFTVNAIRMWDSEEAFNADSGVVYNFNAVKPLIAQYNGYKGGMISYISLTAASTTKYFLSWYNGYGYMTVECSSLAVSGADKTARYDVNSCAYFSTGVGVYTLAQFATEAAIMVKSMRDAMVAGTVATATSWYPVNDNWKLDGEFAAVEVEDGNFPIGNAVLSLGALYVGKTEYNAILAKYNDDFSIDDADVSMPYFRDAVMDAFANILAEWSDWLDWKKLALMGAGAAFGGAVLGPAALLEYSKLKEPYEDARDAYNRLKSVVERIRYYEYITGESAFANKSMIYGGESLLNYKMVPARFMIPVSMYKKVRKRYRRFGFTRHKMVKRSIGIRWAEIRIIDTNVYAEYPQLADDTYTVYKVNQPATITGNASDGFIVSVRSAIEGGKEVPVGAISDEAEVVVDLVDTAGYVTSYSATPEGDTVFHITDDEFDATQYAAGAVMLNVKVPLPPSQDDDTRHDVEIQYSMPNLPRPSEIRHKAFVDYGPFDQSKYSIVERSGNEYKGHMGADGHFIYDTDADGNLVPVVDRVDGWRIFYESSNRIADMRKGMGVFDAAASLLGILRSEFGEKRVELCETMRSMEDEATVCAGGPESEFLSWHNFGLGIKILIYQDDLRTPIAEDSDDFRKLIDVAEAFTQAAREAQVCPKPLNVVWCGRLVMGANIFCWEFLPIGVEHRDAPKFREALLERMDPVERLSYVNVDALGYVVDTPPTEKRPYVLRDSDVYAKAETARGQHYVDPAKVINYLPGQIHRDLPLINVIEFIKMIQLKLAANGTSLTDRANIYEWKAVNETSFRQLVMYFGMTGNLSGATSLICGDFVERYQNIVDMYYTTDIVEFVKNMLGSHYDSAKLLISGVGDGGAYISLADGKIHVFGEAVRSAYDQNCAGNVFGERQINPTKMVRGIERDGIFYTVDEARKQGFTVEYISDRPVIDGYEVAADGTVSVGGGDARTIHAMVASQIKENYEKLKSRFEDYGGSVMYDHYADGPNAKYPNMLENEFGIIAGQTLMGFDALRSMVDKNTVMNGGIGDGSGKLSDDSYGDLDGNGMPLESVYEKVVSNAQLSGVRKASLTKEHVQEIPRSNGLSVERIYSILTAGRKVMANDLMRRK